MKIGFLGMLGLLFIALKLMAYISWSWWYVLLPLYAPLGLVAAIWSMVGLLKLIQHLTDTPEQKKLRAVAEKCERMAAHYRKQ